MFSLVLVYNMNYIIWLNIISYVSYDNDYSVTSYPAWMSSFLRSLLLQRGKALCCPCGTFAGTFVGTHLQLVFRATMCDKHLFLPAVFNFLHTHSPSFLHLLLVSISRLITLLFLAEGKFLRLCMKRNFDYLGFLVYLLMLLIR